MARIQMNVKVVRNNGFKFFDRIQEDEIVYPFAWVDEGILGPTEVMKQQKKED